MFTSTLGEGVIRIALSGFQAVQQQLGKVRESFVRTAEAAQKISTTAAVSFAAAQAAMIGFARAADPLGSLQFDTALARVSVQLGRFFIPLLHQASDALNKVATFLAGLSDQTRETVLGWAKLALAVTGVIVLGGKLVGVFAGIAGALGQVGTVAGGVGQVLWRVLGFLGPWGRAAVIIGTVAAALLGLSKAGEDTEGTLAGIAEFGKQAFATLQDLWGKLTDVVAPALTKAGQVAQSLWTQLTTALSVTWNELTTRLGPPLEKLGVAVGGLLAKLAPLAEAFVARLGRDFERFGQLVSQVFDRLAPVAGKGFERFVAFAERAINGLTAVVERVTPHVERLANWLTAVFESDEGKAFADTFARIADTIGTAADRVDAFAQGVGQAFDSAAKRVGTLVSAVSDVWERLSGEGSGVRQLFDSLSGTFQAIVPHLQKIGETGAKVFAAINDAAKPVMSALKDTFDTLGPPVSRLFDKLSELGGAVLRLGGALYDVFAAKLGGAIEAVRPHVEALFHWLRAGFDAVYPIIKAVTDAIGQGFTAVINGIKNALYSVIEAVTGFIQNTIDGINKLIDGLNKVNPIKETHVKPVEGVGAAPKRPDDVKAPDKLPELANAPKAELPPVPPTKAPDKQPAPTGNSFNGQLLGTARFTGIAEAMRAAQQATVPTRETAILEEINRGQKDGVQFLGKIAQNTEQGSVIGLK